MASIRLSDYSLVYPMFHGSARSFKKSLVRGVRQSLSASQRSDGVQRVGGNIVSQADTTMVLALDSLTLSIGSGERIGLIGHNGAGKSTLLRALAGIYESPLGTLAIDGEIHALLDPQSGMNPDLTGRENIRQYGQMIGLDRKAIARLEQDVEAFAELGAFLDLPVRLYSSGMAIRVGFGLATAPRPEILLMDEWFMAGDHHFQDKARERLTRLIEHVRILVMTSHSLPILRSWCTRIVWMKSGRIHQDGPADAIIDAYEAEQGQA
ncbi:ABC transporter ATP-binding protein [Swaminathania salitolerans]|uniref:Sugar ABC transporter ATP-binding protein n=1 Tax=Swaminathania salitolerans TaxID=182838 RepID=A0A511BL61_9PROT|nr:ABC transporter ATP-binding protein [Swaminathania salitolerans]GBQ09886.1 O-antigen exporter ATP-binding protein [Swaminathania salitolerans LMG 21291]GEL01086.1 sugar ABC transporter ATP-binding protein [Swaminathania salitolerans]